MLCIKCASKYCRCGRSARSCKSSAGAVARSDSGEKSTSSRPGALTRYAASQISWELDGVFLSLFAFPSVCLSHSVAPFLYLCVSVSLSFSSSLFPNLFRLSLLLASSDENIFKICQSVCAKLLSCVAFKIPGSTTLLFAGFLFCYS